MESVERVDGVLGQMRNRLSQTYSKLRQSAAQEARRTRLPGYSDRVRAMQHASLQRREAIERLDAVDDRGKHDRETLQVRVQGTGQRSESDQGYHSQGGTTNLRNLRTVLLSIW